MSEKSKGCFNGFEYILELFERKKKECPKGVSLKKEAKTNGTYLLLQFTDPITKKRTSRSANTNFTEEGIIEAVAKAHKVREKLDEAKTSSEFWTWYDKEILGKNQIKNDSITYAHIFKKIEDKFWSNFNKNTSRKRDRLLPNDQATWERQYGRIFSKFSDWTKQPTWDELEKILFLWEQGTKQFKDTYYVLKRIASYCPDKDELIECLDEIDPKQTINSIKQSISLGDFLKWYERTLEEIESINNPIHLQSRRSWLWVASMCVVYGLRPTEIAAIQNLFQPYKDDGEIIPALNDPKNANLIIYIGDYTYFGISVKTGSRPVTPLTMDRKLIEKLKIQEPSLPIYQPKENSRPITITTGFANQFRDRLVEWRCPVTQTYSFRHLSNQLGELNGIPQEIRARLLGHSPEVNETVYKKRTRLRTKLDIITQYPKQPLSLSMAKDQLEQLGFDLSDKSVQAILRVIYRTDEI